MNYLEAYSFLGLNKQYNHEKIKFLLGSEPQYTLGVSESDDSCLTVQPGGFEYFSTFKHPLDSFVKKPWDVFAFGSEPVVVHPKTGWLLYPVVKLSKLYHELSLTETEEGLVIASNINDVGLENFWQLIIGSSYF